MKFKNRLIKLSYTEEVIIGLIFLFVTLFILLYPKNTENTYFYNENEIPDISRYTFAGERQSETIFNNKYADIVYINKGKLESHLINARTGRKVGLDSFINDEYMNEFNNTVLKFLNLKYPKDVSSYLNKSKDKVYWFKENELTIKYYDTKDLNLDRDFNITINYNDIKDYLNIDVTLDEDYLIDDGYTLDPNKLTVAFSFDDGPNKYRTIKLIDCLENYKMSATFFMVGYKLNNDINTVKYVYNSHSEIGYHSWNHSYLTKQKANIIKEEYQKSDAILNSITGGHFILTRPPYGSYNNTALNALDTPFIRWNLDTNDWKYKDSEYIYDYVIDNIEDGAIILFHDSYDTSVEAACNLMKTLYEKNIQVTSVTNLAKLKNVTLNPHEVYFNFK